MPSNLQNQAILALAALGQSEADIAAAVGVEMGDVESVLGGGTFTPPGVPITQVPYGDFRDYSAWGQSIAVTANAARTLHPSDFDPANTAAAGTSIAAMNSDGSYPLSAGTYSLKILLMVRFGAAQAAGTELLTWSYGGFVSPHGAQALDQVKVRPPAAQAGQFQKVLSDGSTLEYFVDEAVLFSTSDSDASINALSITPKFDMTLEGFEYTVIRVA